MSVPSISIDRCVDCGGVVTIYIPAGQHSIRVVKGVRVNCVGKPVPKEDR